MSQGDEQGVAETYIGSLVALKAKFAFLPHEKYRLAKKGLDIMDHGLGKARNNIEALFIHGSTCYYLPFFFIARMMRWKVLRGSSFCYPTNTKIILPNW